MSMRRRSTARSLTRWPPRLRVPRRTRDSVSYSGIPQVYYVGLLAAGTAATTSTASRTGVGRDINRHYYTADELRVD